jgi:hypothetical protein
MICKKRGTRFFRVPAKTERHFVGLLLFELLRADLLRLVLFLLLFFLLLFFLFWC